MVNVDGIHRYNGKTQCIEWVMDVIDRNNPSGAIEFNVTQRDENELFPVSVSFESPTTMCGADVSEIINSETNEPVKFSHSRALTVQSYSIE